LQQAIKAKKDLRLPYVDLGEIYLGQKKYAEAESALNQAVKLDPTQPDAHYQLGRLYQVQGKKAEAEKELAKVRELHEKADESVAGKMPPPRDNLETLKP
jgi:tetratricopeptide (TPR) repeat protein